MPKRSMTKALRIGRSMAAETLRLRHKAALRRKKALAKCETLVIRRAVSVPRSEVSAAELASASAGVLIAEGDSWFHYPFSDVLKELADEHGFDVEWVSHRGDNVEDMAYSGGQLYEFASLVEKVLRSGVEPRAILLSGGGNDLCGDEFAILLNHAESNIAGLNDSIVTGLIDERLHDSYVTILREVTDVCVEIIGKPVPIVLHGYGYAVPDGRGVLFGWGLFPGPWLEPAFTRKGYKSRNANKIVVVELINRFNAMLTRLAGKPPFSHVRYVDLRQVLSNGNDYKDDWDNELHPTSDGFKKVAEEFVKVI